MSQFTTFPGNKIQITTDDKTRECFISKGKQHAIAQIPKHLTPFQWHTALHNAMCEAVKGGLDPFSLIPQK